MLSLILIDDEYLVRRGLKETVNWEDMGISVVGEASNGAEGLKKAEELKPDIIITDICMPIMNGVDFLREMMKKSLNSVVIVLSGYGEFLFAKEALKNGAFAYILKPIDMEELTATVREAAAKVEKENYRQKLEGFLPMLRTYFLEDILKKRRNYRVDFKREKRNISYGYVFEGVLCRLYNDKSNACKKSKGAVKLSVGMLFGE